MSTEMLTEMSTVILACTPCINSRHVRSATPSTRCHQRALSLRCARADPALQCSSVYYPYTVISVINIGSSVPPTPTLTVPRHSGGFVMFVVRMVCSSSSCAMGSGSVRVCYKYYIQYNLIVVTLQSHQRHFIQRHVCSYYYLVSFLCMKP